MKKALFSHFLLRGLLLFFTTSIFGQNCDFDNIPPQITGCPSNIVIITANDYAIGSWREPIATDNCSAVRMNSNFRSGSRFGTGTVTQVSYSAYDERYNNANCNFTVTVNHLCMSDTIKPVLTNCPSNIIVTSLDSCAIVRWSEPRITDNCGVPTLTSNHQSGDCFPLGTTPVTYWGVDTRYNTSSCSFSVVVSNTPCISDTIKPIINNCPQSQRLTTTDSCVRAYWQLPTATDNCSVPSFVTTHEWGSCFKVGTTAVTYTAKDPSGNTTICRFSIIVDNPCLHDTIKPVFYYCPTNQIVQTLDSTAYVNWGSPYAMDNCSVPTIIGRYDSSNYKVGITPITYKAVDASGNFALCQFTVTVIKVLSFDPCFMDTIKPVIRDCPQNRVFSTYDTCVFVPIENFTAFDNCYSPITTWSSHASGSCFKVGSTTITYKATDAAGNVGICEYKIIVNRLSPTDTCQIDTIAPTIISCPQSFSQNSMDSCVTIYWDVPTITDNCGNPSVTASHRVGDCFKEGMTPVIYTATDGKGNRSICTFTVTIVNPCAGDTIKPAFSFCPQNIVYNTYSTCLRVAWSEPYAYDNCSLTPSLSSNYRSGDCFPVGSTTVTYTATDSKNNKAYCSFMVTVIDPCEGDTIKPTFVNCPQNIVLTALDSTCSNIYWSTPYPYDNCGTPSVISNHNPYDCFPLGNTKVTYTATDSKNNKGYCEFMITIIDACAGDTIKPTFTNCPQNIVTTTQDSSAFVSWVIPYASDNCSLASVVASHDPYAYFKVGTTTVTYTATDNKRNRSVCAFKIIVNNPCFNDTIKPVLKNCPASLTLSSTDSCSIAQWTPPTATDNCSTPSVYGSHQSGFCFKIGSTTVIYTAKDAKNNTATCTFKVTVTNPCFVDTIKPIFYNCPVNMALTTPDSTLAVTWRVPTALDNCSATTITTTNQPNSLFKIGTTTVVYTASDAKNNKSTCSFKVVLTRVLTPCSNDTVKPVFTNCPANISVSTTATMAVVQWATPTATDNCSTPSVSGNFNTGANLPVGTTAVVFTAKDAKGNTQYCRFNVVVTKMTTALVLDSTKCYELVARSSKKALSIANSSTVAGAYAVQWTYLNTLSQKWKITSVDSNAYNLTNKQSNLILDTRWGALTDGTRLMQWTKNPTSATQKWQLMGLTDGYFKVINKGSKLALSVNGGVSVTADGGMMIQSAYSGLFSQQWSILEAPCSSINAALTTNDFLDMDAHAEFNRARIEWTDNTGYKNDYYEIQKLNEKTGDFEHLDIVNNKSFSNTPSYQMAYDNAPMDGENTYRVKVVYLDSLIKFSSIKTLNFNGLETVKLFPNPANDYVDIDLSKFGKDMINIYLYNSLGLQVAFKTVQKDKFSIIHFDISQQEMGNYLMRISAQGKRDILRQLEIVR